MSAHHKPVRVTVSDPETGEKLESRIIEDDYCVITAGRRYVKSVQIMGKTHMLAIACEKAEPAPLPKEPRP